MSEHEFTVDPTKTRPKVSYQTPSINRLLVAVRAVLDKSRVFDFTTELDTELFDELQAAFKALGLPEPGDDEE